MILCWRVIIAPQKRIHYHHGLRKYAFHIYCPLVQTERILYTINWLFHSFPRDHAGAKVKQNKALGEAALQVLHAIVSWKKLDSASYAKLGMETDMMLQLAPVDFQRRKHCNGV